MFSVLAKDLEDLGSSPCSVSGFLYDREPICASVAICKLEVISLPSLEQCWEDKCIIDCKVFR